MLVTIPAPDLCLPFTICPMPTFLKQYDLIIHGLAQFELTSDEVIMFYIILYVFTPVLYYLQCEHTLPCHEQEDLRAEMVGVSIGHKVPTS